MKIQTTISNNLTEDQKELFTKTFYNNLDKDLHDLDSPLPWGCPWYHSEDMILTGNTVEEMAVNYLNEIKQEIKQEIELEGQFN